MTGTLYENLRNEFKGKPEGSTEGGYMETNGTMKQIIELLAKAKGMTTKELKEKVISLGLGVYLIGDATVTRQ